MDAGTISGFIMAYVATLAAVFLLYSPIIVLTVALLLAGGVLQLLLLPLAILIRKLKRSEPESTMDGSWLLKDSGQ
jgi:hypothetical protein